MQIRIKIPLRQSVLQNTGPRKSSYSLVDSKLITQVVDILSDAKEMECSIQIILGIIGSSTI